MSKLSQDENRKINSLTFIMMFCTLVSRMLGFVRVGVVSAFFGAGLQADVLNLVLSIPNNFRKLLAEGALSSAFMPLFASTVGNNKEKIYKTKESQEFFSSLLFWFALFVGVLVVIMNFFAQPIINFLFDFDTGEEKVLAIRLFSFVIYFLFFNTVSAILIGIQQTHKKFFIVSLMPAILSLSVISFVFAFAKRWGIFSAVSGYVFGGFLQIAMLSISLLSLGYSLKLSFKFSQYIKKTLVKMIPAALAVITPIVGQQIAFYLASTLPEGSSSSFAYAIVFWQLPIGVVFNSIIMVSFSHIITELGQNANSNKVFEYEHNSIKSLLFCSIPIAVVMFFLAHGGIAITLQRGKFDAQSVYVSAQVLQGYALALIPYGVYQMMQKFLYARGRVSVVFVFSVLFTFVDVILSVVLIRTKLGVSGLSYAYALSLFLFVPILGLYIIRVTRAHVLSVKEIFTMVLANLPLLVVSIGIWYFTKSLWYKGSTFFNLLVFVALAILLAMTCIIGYKGVGISVISMIRSYKKRI